MDQLQPLEALGYAALTPASAQPSQPAQDQGASRPAMRKAWDRRDLDGIPGLWVPLDLSLLSRTVAKHRFGFKF